MVKLRKEERGRKGISVRLALIVCLVAAVFVLSGVFTSTVNATGYGRLTYTSASCGGSFYIGMPNSCTIYYQISSSGPSPFNVNSQSPLVSYGGDTSAVTASAPTSSPNAVQVPGYALYNGQFTTNITVNSYKAGQSVLLLPSSSRHGFAPVWATDNNGSGIAIIAPSQILYTTINSFNCTSMIPGVPFQCNPSISTNISGGSPVYTYTTSSGTLTQSATNTPNPLITITGATTNPTITLTIRYPSPGYVSSASTTLNRVQTTINAVGASADVINGVPQQYSPSITSTLTAAQQAGAVYTYSTSSGTLTQSATNIPNPVVTITGATANPTITLTIQYPSASNYTWKSYRRRLEMVGS